MVPQRACPCGWHLCFVSQHCGEGGADFLPGAFQRLREHACVADDGHEVRIAIPTRHDMQMYVLRDAGARRAANIHAHVEAIRRHGALSALMISFASCIISVMASTDSSSSAAVWR